ncbi:hypothetical protein VTK73DRAFT_1853 [Phialemonium thermophilum]|uniref:DUF1977 domain-containing protein n=1 Tax=Phialemonium thermophilum TaxID=223376 RepID=A0ABR3VSU8_9PEZI
MWEDEISPEEMFARFFGGGGFGGPFGGFDTGPQFVFNFGGPGIRVHQFGGPRPRRRPRDQERGQEGGIANIIMGLLPILLLFIFPLLSSLFSGSTSQPAAPTMVFDSPLPPLYTQERTMPNLKTKYYVNPKDVEQYSNYKLNQLDKTAEVTLVRRLKTECENEMLHKQRLREAAQGWFFQDPEKMELAEKMEMPNCKRLKKMGIS